tara:strand:- start:26985 stop:27461 length:477 start_codon:yes stop_codon:yes gene_type:complete
VGRKSIEFAVGVFVILAVLAFVMLTFKVSGLTDYVSSGGYDLSADFNNIGGLKNNAPVSVGGVKVGQVTDITLDPTTFQAKVSIHMNSDNTKLPVDTSARILTQGLLGANYIGLSPGGMPQNFKNGDQIQTTYSALVLENLISQYLFSTSNKKSGSQS